MRVIKPGGTYVLTGMVHPDSQLDVTAEQIIRKCLTIHGKFSLGIAREQKGEGGGYADN